MPGGQLFAWDDTNEVWVRLVCDSNGYLKIDKSELFENPPTEDEDKKGPSSEWAFDHAADEDAHHSRYTDAEARASINNIFGSDGKADDNISFDRHYIERVEELYFSGIQAGAGIGMTRYYMAASAWTFWGKNSAGNYIDLDLLVYTGGGWKTLCTETVADSKIATHAADDDAHHAKYTDAEAQAACGLDGTLYTTFPASLFIAGNPASDDVTYNSDGYLNCNADNINFRCPVLLPDGVTVTGVIVYGNAAATAEEVSLKRIKLSDASVDGMAYSNIGTEDTTISNAVIDNSSYVYYLDTSSLDTNDQIYGARISFTL